MAKQQKKNPKKKQKRPYNPFSHLEFLIFETSSESSHQTGSFGRNQYIGTYILSQMAFLRIVLCH